MYVNPDELRTEVELSQRDGRLTERLGVMVMAIVEGAVKRFFGDWGERRWPEVVGAVAVNLSRWLPRLEPDGHLFNFITTAAVNEARLMLRTDRRWPTSFREGFEV